ncbi:MAG: hypothetical protein MUF38_12300 [Anaerolineae bacterium]|jgi:hypothetical protein|nr:hypothetical protein [Anaerolineae bacterium]
MTLTILYTHDLRGDLNALPRLATQLQRLRADAGRVVCVDLGGACAPDVWHCDQTGGRSMVVALDGCGYAAAHADTLQPAARADLSRAILSMQVVDDTHPARVGAIAYHSTPDAHPSAELTIYLRPSDATGFEGGLLRLMRVPRLHIGLAEVEPAARAVIRSDVVAVPPATRPDPTISGLVEFITSETRLAHKKRGG